MSKSATVTYKIKFKKGEVYGEDVALSILGLHLNTNPDNGVIVSSVWCG